MFLKMYIIINKFNIADISFYHLFCNYLPSCCFFMNFFLFLYIVSHFFFCNKIWTFFNGFFIEYIGFLFFLICTLYFILIENSIITCFHLISTSYILFCKLIINLTLILLITQNKFMINPQKIGLNELLAMFNFFLLFICILLSSSDFFIMYLIVEGISLIIYSVGSIIYWLGSIINQSLINIKAVLKSFFVHTMTSSFLLWAIVEETKNDRDTVRSTGPILSTNEIILYVVLPLIGFLFMNFIFEYWKKETLKPKPSSKPDNSGENGNPDDGQGDNPDSRQDNNNKSDNDLIPETGSLDDILENLKIIGLFFIILKLIINWYPIYIYLKIKFKK